MIGKNKSTIGLELKRNSGGRGSRTKQAQSLADSREELEHQPYVQTNELKRKITKRLKKKWSPEQISNRLKLEKKISKFGNDIYI
jgi:transposase, IS30 family